MHLALLFGRLRAAQGRVAKGRQVLSQPTQPTGTYLPDVHVWHGTLTPDGAVLDITS